MSQKSSHNHKNMLSGIALMLILCAALASALVLVPVQIVTASPNGNDTDVILVGTRNWQDIIAATPLAISHAETASRLKPLLLVPTGVDAGERLGWIENKDLVQYGVPPIIYKLKSGGVSTVIINVKDENGFVYFPSEMAEEDAIAKNVNITPFFIDKAHEEGLSVFAAVSCFRDPIAVENHPEWSQVNDKGEKSGDWVCPLNDDYRNYILNLTREVLRYDIDGIVLYDFGYAGSDYCFCEQCKREFWNDTGIDPGKVDLSRDNYNTRKWFDWRENKITDFVKSFVKEVKKTDPDIITGAKLQDPFSNRRSSGYNYEEIAKFVENLIINPIKTRDIRIISSDIGEEASIYVLWSKEDVGDVLSGQNVEETIKNMEDAKDAGAKGVVLDYDIAYTPIWLELKTMPRSISWFISQYSPENVTIIGNANISLPSNLILDTNVSRICGEDICDTAARIASCWNRSQGVVIVNSTDYHEGVEAAPLASYLGWPILFVSDAIPNSTIDALDALGANKTIIIGTVSPQVIKELEGMNITVSQVDANEMLMQEMEKRGEEVNAVVFTNTKDLELIPMKLTYKKAEAKEDSIRISAEFYPAEIPCDQKDTSFYIKVSVTNEGSETVEDVNVLDILPRRREVLDAVASMGSVSISKEEEKEEGPIIIIFPTIRSERRYSSTSVNWAIGDLEPGITANLFLTGKFDFAMDANETKKVDEGITLYLEEQEPEVKPTPIPIPIITIPPPPPPTPKPASSNSFQEKKIMVEKTPCKEIVNVSYPESAKLGQTATITWEVNAEGRTWVEYKSPDSEWWEDSREKEAPGKFSEYLHLTKTGTWEFKICFANKSYYCSTPEYTINVSTTLPPFNVSAFGYTKIPKLSLTAAQIAAARKAPIIDIHKDPRGIIPIEEEESLKKAVSEYKIKPDYLIVVGGIRSVPFVDTGIMQDCPFTYDNYGVVEDYLPQSVVEAMKNPEIREELASNITNNRTWSWFMAFDIYRDYDIQLDEDDFHEVATGRIIGLDVYDASALTARTLAYEEIAEKEDWKSKALVVTNPPTYPQTAIPGDIKEYLEAAGLSVEFEEWEKANCPEVMMEMNNEKNIVFFLHHGAEYAWGLSGWAWLESYLDTTDVKMLRLAPQTTLAYSCLTGRLKGGWYYDWWSDELFYEPFDLDRSIAMAFLEAGSANYIGSNSLAWVFVTEDFSKDFYQGIVYDNMTVGGALTHAKNLYLLKLEYSEDMLEEYPSWSEYITGMINETSKQFILLGDPMFKPYMPKTPEKPIQEEIISRECEDENECVVTMTLTPLNESATKWTYWFERPVVEGKVEVRALPSLVGEIELPIEAEDIVVKGIKGIVWHGEDIIENKKIVRFPVMDPMPKLNEAREFEIKYVFVPKICWTMNLTKGWSMFSSPIEPYDEDVEAVLDDIPYSVVFHFDSASKSWLYYLKDNPEASTLKEIEPGKAYLIDMEEQAELNISGRAVELPFELSLSKGWNMIGVPSTEEVEIGSLKVMVTTDEEYTFDEAVQEGIVSAFVFKYEEGEWDYLDSSETLKPGEGYYFEVFEDCDVVVPGV